MSNVCSLLVKLAVLYMSLVAVAGAGCGGDAGKGQGNPPPSATCVAPASPADTSSPTTVVGDGSAASCTETAFRSAVAGGGIVAFNCGVQDNGGPTKTMLPAAGSPEIGKGTGCPQIDQRGNPRPSACTLGAVEAS